ncbi:MAG: DMT family transporter [Patescibacteria group bacterium]
MFQLVIAAIADASGVVVDKLVLGKHKVPLKVFAPALFLLLFLITGALLPWLGDVDVTALLTPLNFFLFVAMVVIAAAWNILYYKGIQQESIEEFESIILFVPLVTVFFTAILLPEERDLRVFLAAFIASLALIFSHINGKRHLDFDRWSKGLVLAVVLIALEVVIIKKLLLVFSPVALYFARTGFVFLALSSWYGGKFGHMSERAARLTFAAAIMGVVYMVLKFYGFAHLGVLYTTMILILAPFFTLVLDRLVLGERLHWRNIAAIIVILSAIIYTTFVR